MAVLRHSKGKLVRDQLRRCSPSTVLGSVLPALCLVVSAAGCTRTDRADWPRPTHVRVLYCCDHRVYGPYWDMPAKLLVFQSLVTMDRDGELAGQLARSWEHSGDYRQWTIHLRPGVTWHDGVPFTAHDVEFTLDLLRHPDVRSIPPGAFEVAVVDDTTLTIDIAEGGVFQPLTSWEVIFPRHLLKDLDPAEIMNWDFWAQPVGTGAYRYSRHVPNTMSEFIAYPAYWRGEAAIDTVTVKYAESTATELLAGNVDALGWARIEDVPAVADDPDYVVYHDLYPENYRAILWNWRVPALRDARVRRALTLAIDRRELHRVLGLPEMTPVFDVLPRERPFRRGELPPPLPHDAERARQLLADAGWTDGDDDGIRDRDGAALRFSVLVSAEESKAAVFIQRELAEVGVDVEIDQLALNVVRSRIVSGDFDAAIRIFFTGLGGRFGAGAIYGAASAMGYRNDDVAVLLEQAARTVHPDTLDAIYRRLWPHFQRDLPMTYLAPGVQAFVAHRRIRGLDPGFRAAPLMNMEYLRVDDEP